MQASRWTCVAMLVSVLGTSATAHAYSTKLHMITGQHIVELVRQHNCQVPLRDWNHGHLAATQTYLQSNRGPATHSVRLNPELCGLIKNYSQYFLAATTGPDTFPGMFGNTDPTHALLWNTAWQIQILWQNAKTPREKAFVLGWLVHFAGDLNAHGLANLHAHGVWMEGGRPETVYRHILTETYYAGYMLPYPKGFDNTLVWPEEFVKKMFFNPRSPLYQHYDHLLSKNPKQLGAVAKAFGAAYRTMFLLWDFHGRHMHRWRGRMDYYEPKTKFDFARVLSASYRKQYLSDFFHWLFADQAYNFHKKKMLAMKKVIDRWYEATHRAQQAIVSDKRAKFTGNSRYDKVYVRLGQKRVKKGFYRAKGLGGVIDAYKYLMGAIGDYFSPDLITITDQNFPVLRKILDSLKLVGAAAMAVIDGIKAALKKLKEILLWPFKKIKEAILRLLDPAIQRIKKWVFAKLHEYCGKVSAMCKSIQAQRTAFQVIPGKLDTYLNWPIYRNTITAAALMLEKFQATNKIRGDETQSPVFGLPSGDFGCTGACTGVRREHARLYMPMAGLYYQSKAIAQAFPDYCMAKADARRRKAPLNETYVDKTNDDANGGFTCFEKSGPRSAGERPRARSMTGPCKDAYAAAGPRRFDGQSGGFFGQIEKAIIGPVYEALVGRWDFRKHPAPRSATLVRSVGRPKDDEPICYPALGYGPQTLVQGFADADAGNQKYYRREPYALQKVFGNISGVGDLLQKGWGFLKDWAKTKLGEIKDKAKKKLGEIKDKAVTFVKEKIVGAISAAVCKAKCAWRAKSWCGVRPCLDGKLYDACKKQKCGLK